MAEEVVVVDYGMGNIKSIHNALRVVGADPQVVEEPSAIPDADAIVLPGVGAFADGMRHLREQGFVEPLQEAVVDEGVPYLGLCLGMQFLATDSHEHGTHDGLGWVEGTVERIEPESEGFRVPHMGWNDVDVRPEADEVLYRGFDDEPVFYFVHSYHLVVADGTEDVVSGTSWHGTDIVASVRRGNVFGVQFHPEKSQGAGLRVLENFVEYASARDD